MIVQGIDISNRQNTQGEIVWPAVADADLEFCWAKVSEGLTYHDPFFLGNVAGARSIGLPIGGYHFGRPADSSADLQAQHFRSLCGPLDLPPFADAEGAWLPSVQANTDWYLRFLDALGDPIRLLYTNRDGALNHLDSNRLVAAGVELFYAHPGALSLGGVGAWADASVVQVGYRTVAGITGNVDADEMDADTLARYTHQTPAPPGPTPSGEDVTGTYVLREGSSAVALLLSSGEVRGVSNFADLEEVLVHTLGVKLEQYSATTDITDTAGNTRPVWIVAPAVADMLHLPA